MNGDGGGYRGGFRGLSGGRGRGRPAPRGPPRGPRRNEGESAERVLPDQLDSTGSESEEEISKPLEQKIPQDHGDQKIEANGRRDDGRRQQRPNRGRRTKV